MLFLVHLTDRQPRLFRDHFDEDMAWRPGQVQRVESFPDLDTLARIFDGRRLRLELAVALRCALFSCAQYFVTVIGSASRRRGHKLIRESRGIHRVFLAAGDEHYIARVPRLLGFRYILDLAPGDARITQQSVKERWLVNPSAVAMSASEAARQLGVSIKALRVYEQRGLLAPSRTAAGYRVYHPQQMARAARIVALRSLGLRLSQVARVLDGDQRSADVALAAHEQTLEKEIRRLVSTLEKVRSLRADRASGRAPQPPALNVTFDLPWPWAGERFELTDVHPINYIVGPLGSGKTRFARRLAEAIPGATFLALERTDTADALTVLLDTLQAPGPTAIVVDMVEQGLDRATQETLSAHLRERAKLDTRPLFLMTRSSSILNLAAVGPDEAIVLCPANHSPPIRVAPYPGTPGYEAVATCLASPEVRARTAGVIAWRRQAS